MSESDVYQTKLVHSDPSRDEQAMNHFSSLGAAKQWLEGYLDIRLGVEDPPEWEHHEDALEEYVIRGDLPQGFQRAVVMTPRVRDSAEEPLRKLREIEEMMNQ